MLSILSRYAAALAVLVVGGCTPHTFVVLANVDSGPILVSALLRKGHYGSPPEFQCPPQAHIVYVSAERLRSVKSAEPELLLPPSYELPFQVELPGKRARFSSGARVALSIAEGRCPTRHRPLTRSSTACRERSDRQVAELIYR